MLCYFSGICVDGQYINKKFINAVHSLLNVSQNKYAVPVMWDTAHLLNLAINDIRDGKKGFGKGSLFLNRLIDRSNTFCHLMGHGKGFAVLKQTADNNDLSLHMPLIYAKQRWVFSDIIGHIVNYILVPYF